MTKEEMLKYLLELPETEENQILKKTYLYLKGLLPKDDTDIKSALKSKEEKVYTLKDGRKLTDDEIMSREMNETAIFLKETSRFGGSNINYDYEEQKLLNTIAYYMDYIKRLIKTDIKKAKKYMAYIEMILGIKSGLYLETYECFEEKLLEAMASSELDLKGEKNNIFNDLNNKKIKVPNNYCIEVNKKKNY